MWHEVDWAAVAREERARTLLLSPGELEQYAVMIFRELMAAGVPCGATAVRRRLQREYNIQPLPSVSTFRRILEANCMTDAWADVYYPGIEKLAPRQWRPDRKDRW